MSKEKRGELNLENQLNEESEKTSLVNRESKPIESGDFVDLNKRFLSFKEKDVNAHLVGTAFSYLLIILGLLLLYICLVLFETEIPRTLLVQMGFVIAFQIAIGLLERVRLRRVSWWYKSAKSGGDSLSEIQGSMLGSLDSMIRLSLLNLILCFIFIYLQVMNHALVVSSIDLLEVPVYLPNYEFAVNLYMLLILLTRLMVLFYLVYLGWRLMVWIGRKKELNQIEITIQKEIPDFNGLAELQNSHQNQ